MNKVVIDDSKDDIEELNAKPESDRSKARTHGRLAVVMLIVGLLLVFMSVAYFIFLRDNDDTSQQNTNNQQSSGSGAEAEKVAKLLKPGNIVYADKATDAAPYVVYTRPATGGERVPALTLPDDAYINHAVVRGNKVAIASSTSSDMTNTIELHYSPDGGVSYKKIFSRSESLSASDFMGTQITSLVFSHDNSSIVMGMLDKDFNSRAAVLSLEDTKEPETVFTAGQKAIFLVGYDTASKRAVYFTGCYNCDGNVSNPLYTRVGSGAEIELFASPALFLKVAMNDDFKSVLIAEGTKPDSEPEFLGDSSVAPYTLYEVALVDKAKKTIGTVTEGQVQTVGYSVQGVPYAATESEIIRFSGPGQIILQTSGTLNIGYSSVNTGFVGEDEVVYSQIINPQTGSDFVANYFKVGGTSPVKIFEGGPNTYLLGVTRQ